MLLENATTCVVLYLVGSLPTIQLVKGSTYGISLGSPGPPTCYFKKHDINTLYHHEADSIHNTCFSHLCLVECKKGSSKYKEIESSIRNTTAKLTTARAQLATTKLKQDAAGQRLEAFRKQLQEKQHALQQATRSTGPRRSSVSAMPTMQEEED